ncbi:hypothetical protein ACFYKX_03580 [Cytobacillus sp. FJAT-54145]|uniref:Uncharacterized protein n=1 Tax=Cytobacillus spartinae TaxID=3299023 RepID=A0ABW6K699_9BACI
MKKKLLITTVSLSALLLVGTTVSIFANHDGYDLYKQAMKNTHKVNNAALSFDASMTSNGQLVQKVEVDSKYNLDQKLAQGELSIETPNQVVDLNVYYQDHHVIIKNDQVENDYVIEGKQYTEEERKELYEKHHNPELLNLMEKVFDTLTIQTHDEFVVSQDNGKQTITVDLTKEEIPSLIHQGSQYMIKKMLETHDDATMTSSKYPFLESGFTMQTPVLVDDITLEEVKIQADLTEEKLIDNQHVYVKVAGIDKNGKQQVLELEMNMDYANINSTTLQPTTDLTDAIKLDQSLFKHGR